MKTLYERIAASNQHRECIDCIGPRTVGVSADMIVQIYTPIHNALQACSSSEEECMECASDPSSCGPAPYNDLCNNRWPSLTMGSIYSGTTVGASQDNLNACYSASSVDAPGVWYSIEGNGLKLTATTCTGNSYFDGDFDSQIAVYTGACSSLICVAGSNDDGNDSCGTESRATWQSVQGLLYRIHVYGYNTGETGSFGLVVRPGNERCIDAEGPLPLGSIVAGSTVGGTNNNVPACYEAPAVSSSAGVWYWTRGTGQLMKATTCTGNSDFDGDFDSVISIWEGACGSLSCVAGNDDGSDSCGTESAVAWESDSGRTYFIHVYGYHDDRTGSFGLVVRPGNEQCADAEGPLSLGTIVAGSTIGGIDSNIPMCEDASSGSSPGVWYKVTGTGDRMKATTCTGDSNFDGDFDSVISVWEGPCTSLRCIAGNDDDEVDDCGTESTATWESDAGHTYFIHVYGYYDDLVGSFGLVVQEEDDSSMEDPSSDFPGCSSAIELSIGSVVAATNVRGDEDDLPECFDSPEPEGPGVWFMVVGNGQELTATTCTRTNLDGDFDSILSVWEGPCSDLSCEGGDDDGDEDCGS